MPPQDDVAVDDREAGADHRSRNWSVDERDVANGSTATSYSIYRILGRAYNPDPSMLFRSKEESKEEAVRVRYER